jgi:lipopolysaccharide assembly protein A
MQVVRTVVWVVLIIALLLFSLNNWNPVEIKIWEGLILETKLPALVLVAFLLGLLPMWLLAKAGKWRLTRRIDALENSVRASAAPPPPASAGEPVS